MWLSHPLRSKYHVTLQRSPPRKSPRSHYVTFTHLFPRNLRKREKKQPFILFIVYTETISLVGQTERVRHISSQTFSETALLFVWVTVWCDYLAPAAACTATEMKNNLWKTAQRSHAHYSEYIMAQRNRSELQISKAVTCGLKGLKGHLRPFWYMQKKKKKHSPLLLVCQIATRISVILSLITALFNPWRILDVLKSKWNSSTFSHYAQ